ncbi:MAG: hypothetical protein AAFR09_01155 [Pseudomonadota bacterium]
MRRDDIARLDTGVCAHARRGAPERDVTRLWQEIPCRVLGVQPYFDRMPGQPHVILPKRQRTALGDIKLQRHKIEACD